MEIIIRSGYPTCKGMIICCSVGRKQGTRRHLVNDIKINENPKEVITYA